jgi:DNA-binding MarR family transcriptional regulator
MNRKIATNRKVRSADYRALAEFRYHIRRFLNVSDQAAREAGLEPHQYQALLAIRGLPEGEPVTISALAGQMQLRHHSAVELIDRMVSHGIVRRIRSTEDRREVRVGLSARGKAILEKLAQERLAELRSSGPGLVRALNLLVERTRNATEIKRSKLPRRPSVGRSAQSART